MNDLGEPWSFLSMIDFCPLSIDKIFQIFKTNNSTNNVIITSSVTRLGRGLFDLDSVVRRPTATKKSMVQISLEPTYYIIII